MCRIVAFPPGFPREKALDIVKDFYIGNEDGTGSVYVKDGKFVVNKWNFSFEKVIKRGLPLFDHMPYNGWTLAHVRAASHGKNTVNNTHPFVKGEYAMVHNGIFQDYAPVRAALSATHKFKGQTDSEVAAVLWKVAGKEKFVETVSSGVFMFLNKNGRVNVVCKAGGDLVFQRTKYGVVMSSELPTNYNRKNTVMEGNFTLGKNGKLIYENWDKDDAANWNFNSTSYRGYFPKKQSWKKKKSTEIVSTFEDDDIDDLTKNGFVWMT